MRGAGPFSDRIESSVPSAVLQVLRWGRRSATLRSVFAAHGPTSCFSPTRTGVLADLSGCKPLPGIAVNGALVWRQVTAAISGSTSGTLTGLDNAGYRWLGRPAVTLKVCRGDRGRDAGATSRTSQLDENDDIGTNGKPAG